VRGGRLVMSDAIRVVPRQRADQIDGVVAATRPFDLEALSASLAQRGFSGWLRLEQGSPLPVGLATREAPRSDEEMEVATAAGTLRLGLRGRAPGRSGGAAWYSALALGLLGVALSLRGILWRARGAVALASPERGSSAHGALGGNPAAIRPSIPARHPESDRGPRRIGRYNLLKRLGTGGMAEVYLGRLDGEAGFSKLFAVKVLQPSFARQPIVVEHFLDEARLASRLDHPNVVQVLDLGSADGEFFIAMEFVDGADLFRLIELNQRLRRAVPIPVALGILRRICDGLHAAHTMRTADGRPLDLVHRDVKSANVFVSKDGAVKIGDFGIAKANDAVRVGRTEVGMVKGTPGYMAPEQRMSQVVDAGADLYGVGAIAYELLSGAPINLDLAVLAQKGTTGWPHLGPLSDFRDDVPPELTALIFRALAYERQDRFSDCAALEAGFAEIANGYSASAAIEKSIGRWATGTLAAAAPSIAQPPEEDFGKEVAKESEEGRESSGTRLRGG
jgi:serine/threonine protein kinase